MNKELLSNPEVREIAEAYIKFHFLSDIIVEKQVWNDFVKANEPFREWEILEFKNGNNHIISKRENGLFLNDMQPTLPGAYTLEDTLKNDHNQIFKVKRLSDGEQFSVGDTILLHGEKGVIEKFSMANQLVMNVDVRFGYITYGKCNLSFYEKVKREHIFITDDNVKIYEGEIVCMLNKQTWKTCPLTANEGMIRDCGYYKEKEKFNFEFFSNDAVAQEYVLMNRPCLSIQAMLDNGSIAQGSPQTESLINLAKTKL